MKSKSARKPKRPVVQYAESYVQPGLKILDRCLPQCPHAATGFVVAEAYITKAGSVEMPDGRRLEFQDLRVYFSEEPTPTRSPEVA